MPSLSFCHHHVMWCHLRITSSHHLSPYCPKWHDAACEMWTIHQNNNSVWRLPSEAWRPLAIMMSHAHCTILRSLVLSGLQFCASIFTFIFVEATSHQPLLALFESQNPLYAISTFTSLVCPLVGAFNKEWDGRCKNFEYSCLRCQKWRTLIMMSPAPCTMVTAHTRHNYNFMAVSTMRLVQCATALTITTLWSF